jgi:hypothetical protein
MTSGEIEHEETKAGQQFGDRDTGNSGSDSNFLRLQKIGSDPEFPVSLSPNYFVSLCLMK